MEYRQLEKLGIQTSLLGFGCMRFPKHRDGSIHEERAEQLIDTAFWSGVNYFDTAYIYHDGTSEKFIGKALDKYDRNSYYLATKLPCWMVKTIQDAERIFNDQLSRLNKDYVDFYLLHALDKKTFDRMVDLGVLELMDQLKKEGKIRYFGFSFHDDFDAFSYILKYRDWDFCQIQLNYMDTDIQAGMKGYELTEELNVPLVIMEPVKGGRLVNLPSSAAKHFEAVAPGKSAASWALRWVASLPNVKVVLSGMSDAQQVKDNLDTLGNFEPLNELEHQTVEDAVKIFEKRMKNGCTGCAYCMPCPAGVNIPKNFNVWNDYGMYHRHAESKWSWANEMIEKEKAKNCIGCGKCETVCPQKLNIRENLKQLQIEMDRIK